MRGKTGVPVGNPSESQSGWDRPELSPLTTEERRGPVDDHYPNHDDNRPNRLTQCCTQFKSLWIKVLCVLYLHDNVAFLFK